MAITHQAPKSTENRRRRRPRSLSNPPNVCHRHAPITELFVMLLPTFHIRSVGVDISTWRTPQQVPAPSPAAVPTEDTIRSCHYVLSGLARSSAESGHSALQISLFLSVAAGDTMRSIAVKIAWADAQLVPAGPQEARSPSGLRTLWTSSTPSLR